MSGPHRAAGSTMWLGVVVLTLVAGCRPATPTPTPPGADATSPETTAVRIDPDRLFETVSTLASDGLGGRYSLHQQDIRRAADYIATAFQAAGIAPVGTDYRHDFTMVVGAKLTASPTITVHRGGRPYALAADEFVPLTVGSSGTLDGADIVFVGYAAHAEENSPVPYDDLDGVDLEGKVALLLMSVPNRPPTRALYRALRQLKRRFDASAAPLRESGDADALAKLHAQSIARMADLVRPYLAGRSLPSTLTEPPADPLKAEVEISPFTSAVFTPPAEAKVPRFAYRAGRTTTQIERLVDAGAAGVIVVQGPRTFLDESEREEDRLPDLDDRPVTPAPIPVVQMKWAAADRVFRIGRKTLSQTQAKIDQTWTPRSRALAKSAVDLSVAIEAIEVPVPNVLATIPGKSRPDEIVIMGAHYDHIGTDEEGHGHCSATGEKDERDAICNGADDNASGTAVVLETARVMAGTGFQPDRTLVFALFAGEELGLRGSQALANSPPALAPFVRGKVVAMVNIDMVGRLGARGLLVGGVGSSPAWMPLLDKLGNRGMDMVFDSAITARSDHASFYKHDIPVLFFFTGVHDDYHAPGDESAAINRDGLAAIAEYIHDLVHEVAGVRDVPFAEPKSTAEGLVGALPGDNPDTVVKEVRG